VFSAFHCSNIAWKYPSIVIFTGGCFLCLNVTRIIISVLVAIMIAMIVIASVLWNTGERLPMLQAYLKIIISHFQIMMVVTSVHYKWAKEVKYF
jgi:hypothetical protein